MRRAGGAWLALVGIWALPALVATLVDPDSPSLVPGWALPATLALMVVAVVATLAWGGIIERHAVASLVGPSVVLGTAVVLAWSLLILAVATADSLDVNGEAVALVLGVVTIASAVGIAATLALGRAVASHGRVKESVRG